MILHNAKRPTKLQHPAWLQALADRSAAQLTQAILYPCSVKGGEFTHSQECTLQTSCARSKREGSRDNESEKYKTPAVVWPGFCVLLKPGDDLLSHGETPHYHRRCTVSLLSSEWIRWFQYSIVARQTGVNGKQHAENHSNRAVNRS